MTTPQIDVQGVLLVNEVVDLARSNSRSELDIARLRKLAQSQLGVDRFHAGLALGMLAALARNADDMRRYHEQAARLQPSSVLPLMNFAFSLQMMNFYSEAYDWVLKAHAVDPSNIGVLEEAVQSASVIGQFDRCAPLIEKWKKLKPNEQFTKEPVYRRFVAFQMENQISENEIGRLIEIASANLRQAGVFASGIDVGLIADEDSEWLNFDLVVPAPVNTVVELNTRLARQLADLTPSLKIEEKVLVMYLVAD